MAKEKKDYREQIAIISGMYPGRATLSVTETAKVLGIDRRTVKSLIERRSDPLNAIDIGKSGKNKIYIIPVTAIARFTG
jgi:hypothetical protein